MTVKRFVIKPSSIVNDGFVIIDKEKEHTFPVLESTLNYMFCKALNELHEENYKIKSLLLNKVEELNDAYNESARAGMPTGGIIGELYSLKEICRIMRWIE